MRKRRSDTYTDGMTIHNTEGMAIISQRYLKKNLRSVPIMNENEPEKVKGFMLENIILHNIVC